MDLLDLSETELLEGWKEHNVTDVQSVTWLNYRTRMIHRYACWSSSATEHASSNLERGVDDAPYHLTVFFATTSPRTRERHPGDSRGREDDGN